MAFTFIVEDGTIVANANSYLTVEEATAILEIDDSQFAIWDALTTEEKQKALVRATLYLDDFYQWYGRRTDPTQSLKWPRSCMKDCEGNAIGENVMPVELKRATTYLAMWMRTNNAAEQMDSVGVRRFRSEEVEIEWQDGYYGQTAPSFLTRYLICFGLGPGDRGFKPIIRK